MEAAHRLLRLFFHVEAESRDSVPERSSRLLQLPTLALVASLPAQEMHIEAPLTMGQGS